MRVWVALSILFGTQGFAQSLSTTNGRVVRPQVLEQERAEEVPCWEQETFVDGYLPAGQGQGKSGTAFDERFHLYLPGCGVNPLLVYYHGFGGSHLSYQTASDFLNEARRQRMGFVSFDSASPKHMNSPEAQRNTESGLDWVFANYGDRIDLNRIYGVGFSLGGTLAIGYAARHLGVFAAVASLSAATSMKYQYTAIEPDPSPNGPFPVVGKVLYNYFFGLFDAVPVQQIPYPRFPMCADQHWECAIHQLPPSNEFELNRASVIAPLYENSLQPNEVDFLQSLYLNLAGVTSVLLYYTMDDAQHIKDQNEALFVNLSNMGGADVTRTVIDNRGGRAHAWDNLDEATTLNLLKQKTLGQPSAHTILADRDHRYLHFDIYQEAQGFTPLQWSTNGNRVNLMSTRNLSSIRVYTDELGLNTSVDLEVRFATLAGSTDDSAADIRVRGYTRSPMSVTRDDQPAPWSFDPIEGVVILHETTVQTPHAVDAVWRITP